VGFSQCANWNFPVSFSAKCYLDASLTSWFAMASYGLQMKVVAVLFGSSRHSQKGDDVPRFQGFETSLSSNDALKLAFPGFLVTGVVQAN